MTSAVQNSITNAMTWDALGRMLTEATTGLGTVASEYDLAGRRTKVTLPGATSLFANYDYDLLGNPEQHCQLDDLGCARPTADLRRLR